MIRRQTNVRFEAVERTHARGTLTLMTRHHLLGLVNTYQLDLVFIAAWLIRAILLSTFDIDLEQVVDNEHLGP